MNLNDYFKKYRANQIAETAKGAGTSLGYLRCCLYGQRRMSADIALLLEQSSHGEMTAHELRPDLPWPQLKPRNEADRANDPPLMPAPHRENPHARRPQNTMQS